MLGKRDPPPEKIEDLHVRPEPVAPRGKQGGKLLDLVLDTDFLYMAPKTQATKAKISN